VHSIAVDLPEKLLVNHISLSRDSTYLWLAKGLRLYLVKDAVLVFVGHDFPISRVLDWNCKNLGRENGHSGGYTHYRKGHTDIEY
jgi:O-methyltransferase involved in polyketide biosynthesis